MTIARKLRDAAMGPAPKNTEFVGSWVLLFSEPYWRVFEYAQGEAAPYLSGLTEDECRALLYLLSMVVRDEK